MLLNIPRRSATMMQIKFIESLLIDVGIGIDRMRRNTQLTQWFRREIKFLDELSVDEGRITIERLKMIKESQRETAKLSRIELNPR